MNLLTINSFDCSAQAMGGVNQTTATLSTFFTHQCGVNCYLGFFENMPSEFEPLPVIKGRILLNRHFDEQAFAEFLHTNKIDIVQVNFLKKHNLKTIPQIYKVAHQCGAKVIYAFHMCPGFQSLTYGSWERMIYGWRYKDNAEAETKKWILTQTNCLWKGIARRALQSKYRIPYEQCDKIVVLSKYYVPTYLYYAGLKNSNKMEAIGNALRFHEYATDEDISNKQKTVIVVARFDEDTKRISLALKAWRQIETDSCFNEWKLQLVGDGRDRDFYEYLARRLNLQRVEFTGRQNPMEYYRKASLFLMTSTAEGWPLVLMEATQMGVPVVAMDSFGSLHDIVEDGVNGRIVPNNDIPAFIQAMKEMMRNDKERQQMARCAVENCKQFEIQNILKRWTQLFNELMQDK